MSSSILFSCPSRALLETDNPRARADVVDVDDMDDTFVWVVRVEAEALRFVGRKWCCWSACITGRAGSGIVGGGAFRDEMCKRRIGRRLG